MFLLIRDLMTGGISPTCKFTFQYVSINTELHQAAIRPLSQFTFQYVSINTQNVLLQLRWSAWFTFQYVSINTTMHMKISDPSMEFTFQYVSINTISAPWIYPICLHLHSNMFLLIPDPEAQKERLPPHLHSNMFLLIRRRYWPWNWYTDIYIPICFY